MTATYHENLEIFNKKLYEKTLEVHNLMNELKEARQKQIQLSRKIRSYSQKLPVLQSELNNMVLKRFKK